MFAIDGCKMTSNASKEWSGTKKELKNKIKKIRGTIKLIMSRHQHQDENESKATKKSGKDSDKIDRVKLKIKKIKDFLKSNEPLIGQRGNETKSNITDNESAKIKSSHGWVQGYISRAKSF